MTWGDIENFYTGLLTLLMDGEALDSGMMTPEWDAFLTSALDRVLPTRYIYGGDHRYELRGFEVIQETGDGAYSCGKLCDFKRTAEKMTLIYKNGDHIDEHGERVSQFSVENSNAEISRNAKSHGESHKQLAAAYQDWNRRRSPTWASTSLK